MKMQSEVLFPSIRMPVKVHHRRNDDLLRTNLVNQTIGKPIQSTASLGIGDRSPSLQKIPNPDESRLNLRQEIRAQAGNLLLVVCNRARKLGLGRRKRSLIESNLRERRE